MKSLDDRVPTTVIAGCLGISVQVFLELVGKGVVSREGRPGYPLRPTLKACFCLLQEISGWTFA